MKNMFSHLDLLFSSTALEGPEQMALDEVLMYIVKKPLLRIYQWEGGCVTFGYFQKEADLRKNFPKKTLVRRWTGGGAVEHENDITFSLIVPSNKTVIKMPPSRFYEVLHQLMGDALEEHHLITHLATPENSLAGDVCFSAPTVHDLLSEDQKILGGAQRRCAGSLLYQGSLLLPRPLINPDIKKNAIFLSFASFLASEVELIGENPTWLTQARELAKTRYRSMAWLTKR